MPVGIVLAAGEATRMPNKLMLATPSQRPLIMGAIEYAMRCCGYVIVVTRKDSIVEAYLRRIPYKLDIRFQSRPTGVVDAISIAKANDILVTFGDCYGYDRLPSPLPNHATVVSGSLPGIDGWDGEKWVTRSSRSRAYSFVGAFRCDSWKDCSSDLMYEFNRHNIKPQVVNTNIVDCGTQEGYLKLWQQ